MGGDGLEWCSGRAVISSMKDRIWMISYEYQEKDDIYFYRWLKKQFILCSCSFCSIFISRLFYLVRSISWRKRSTSRIFNYTFNCYRSTPKLLSLPLHTRDNRSSPNLSDTRGSFIYFHLCQSNWSSNLWNLQKHLLSYPIEEFNLFYDRLTIN